MDAVPAAEVLGKWRDAHLETKNVAEFLKRARNTAAGSCGATSSGTDEHRKISQEQAHLRLESRDRR